MEYASTSDALNYEASVAVSQQIDKLQALVTKLENHSDVVMEDPELRAGLVHVAKSLGVDPFQLQLKPMDPQERKNRIAVSVVEICHDLNSQNVGNFSIPQLCQKLTKHLATPVTREEALTAIRDLSVLGPGLRLETLPNGTQVVRSAADELSSDQGSVLAACDALGFVTSELLQDNLGWTAQRADAVLDDMVSAGLLWVDLQCAPCQFWTPSAI